MESKSKIISIRIATRIELVYVLEFVDEKMQHLRRIACKVDHPSYAFKIPKQAQDITKRFDAQCDLVLYLSGEKFRADSYTESVVPKYRKYAPMKDFWDLSRY